MLTADPPVLAEKYRLIRQLEAGGMGSVWLAEHIHLESLVAVKLMSRAVAATPAGTERFLREARTAASLRSPNVVQILDYGLHDGTPFIAMELLEGETLAARLDREGRFPSWERAERVLRQIARAVARAHDAGIIHRDLKPANIFLVRDEEEEVVKLLDFGIAKTLEPLSASLGSNTRTGEFLGSPVYASPEQLQVSKALDHRADIWSLGVLAYECWIGRPPFADDTLVGLVLAICSHPLPVPSEQGSVPAGFDAWFARACARDVERRFQSVREASAELRSLVAAASGQRLSVSEAENSFLSEAARLPLALPESVPAVQTPPSTPTVRQPGFSTLALPSGDTVVMRRSEARHSALAARAEPRSEGRRMATLVGGLTLLAVIPLLVALRAPAGAPSESNLPSVGAAPGEPLPSVEPAPSEPLPSLEAAPSVEPAPSVEAAPSVEPVPSTVPAVEGVPPGSPQTSVAEVPSIVSESAAAALPSPKPVHRPKAPRVRATTTLRDGERSAPPVATHTGERERVGVRLEQAGDGLDQAAVQSTLRSYGPSVRDICWERALSERAPDAPTTVRISTTITVDPSGRVRSVATTGAPAAYPELSACIEAKVRAWTFPRARAETVVNVPFVFVTE